MANGAQDVKRQAFLLSHPFVLKAILDFLEYKANQVFVVPEGGKVT